MIGRRALDWNGLVDMVKLPPPERLVEIAGVPARVVKHLSTDVGFYVRTVDEDAGDAYWSLRTREEMRLLRQLVEAGAVTVEDPDADEIPDWAKG